MARKLYFISSLFGCSTHLFVVDVVLDGFVEMNFLLCFIGKYIF